VTHLEALEYDFRPFMDRDPLWNMGLLMFPGVASVFTLTMGSHQGQNEVWDFLVDPLIDCFMANGESRVFNGQSSGDKFWRPSQVNMFFDILTNGLTFESWSPVGFLVTFIGSFLCFVSQVIAGINRRGISLKLPGKGAGTSLENLCDFP
jgi:hypothetical protein